MTTNNGNPYFIDEPAVISFSGGRSSGFMLRKILDAHDGRLPNSTLCVFANTGKEAPQTLDFVRDIQEKWNVPITWVEGDIANYKGPKKNKKFTYSTKVVDYETASRNGEPFARLIKVRNYAPNVVARFCTAELKVRRINQFAKEFFGDDESFVSLIGLRADEPRRVAKLATSSEGSGDKIAPMAEAGHTVQDVSDFWKSNDFDLNLINDNGVTPMGNCDLCFLKGPRKKQSIININPSLADWWIEQEKDGKLFRADQPSYATMKERALRQGNLLDVSDLPDIECVGCTD